VISKLSFSKFWIAALQMFGSSQSHLDTCCLARVLHGQWTPSSISVRYQVEITTVYSAVIKTPGYRLLLPTAVHSTTKSLALHACVRFSRCDRLSVNAGQSL